MERCYFINFDIKKDARGCLTIAESDKEIPFNIMQRIFYLTDTVLDRGGHANKNSQFVFFVVKGSVEIKAKYKNESEVFKVINDGKALYMDKLVWKDMCNFSQDCILVVLSDCKYDKTEYINNYDEYVKILNSKE